MTAEKKKILVAEDNQVMADVVRFNLERAGYDVAVTNSGQEALDQLAVQQFDLLLTDFQMPEVNGDELCQKILGDERHTEMKIIMCSAKGYELNVDQLQRELNIYRIIFKPFSPVQMKLIVAEALEIQTAAS